MDKKEINHGAGWHLYPTSTIFESPIVTLCKGPVRCLRSGRKKQFYRLDFPDWVNVVAITPQKEILLIKQFRYGTGRLEIEIPGGMINRREDPVLAGLRELEEETGYGGEKGRLIGQVSPNPAIQSNICYTVLVENARKITEAAMDEMEDIEIEVVPFERCYEMVRNGEISHGLVLNAIMYYLLAAGTDGFWGDKKRREMPD